MRYFKESLIQFKDNIKTKLNTLIMIISQLLPEMLIMCGLFFIVFTTFKINPIAGYYCLGGILLFAGLFSAKVR